MKEWETVHRSGGREFLLTVERSSDPRDYERFENLRFEVWADPEDRLAGRRNQACENYFNLGSSLFISAYAGEGGGFPRDERRLAAFSYGFAGVVDKTRGYADPSNFRFYSQYTAVKKDFQGCGLGIAVKELQRDVVLNVFRIPFITCTFDPLTSVNAHRNVHHFGMEVLEYKPACYENYTGHLNRLDLPCDRFFMLWDLRRPVRRADDDLEALVHSGSAALEAEMRTVSGRSGPLPLEVVGSVNLDLAGEYVWIEIPFDLYAMLHQTDVSDPDVRRIPLDWRQASREVFVTYLGRGYRVVDFQSGRLEGRRRSLYVLRKD